jgi:hypothetical protein
MLYPSIMLKDLPIGCLIESTTNYFGFCYASVNVPEGIKAPVLRKENGGLIYPSEQVDIVVKYLNMLEIYKMFKWI